MIRYDLDIFCNKEKEKKEILLIFKEKNIQKSWIFFDNERLIQYSERNSSRKK